MRRARPPGAQGLASRDAQSAALPELSRQLRGTQGGARPRPRRMPRAQRLPQAGALAPISCGPASPTAAKSDAGKLYPARSARAERFESTITLCFFAMAAVAWEHSSRAIPAAARQEFGAARSPGPRMSCAFVGLCGCGPPVVVVRPGSACGMKWRRRRALCIALTRPVVCNCTGVCCMGSLEKWRALTGARHVRIWQPDRHA